MDEDGPRSQRVPGGGGADLISALPEDLLLQILVRLRCARAAARTSLLARRWRGLWARLPDLVFRDVAARSILRALTSLQGADGPGVSLLDIRVPGRSQKAARLRSLLHAAAGLSSAELRFALTHNLYEEDIDVDLSSFQRATSVELRLRGPNLRLTLSPRLLALERLTLSGCGFDLAALFPRCPCLRVLRLADNGYHTDDITIRSESLEELDVESPYGWTTRINIEAPMLKRLMLSFRIDDVLQDSEGQRLLTDTGEDSCLQLSNVYVLSLELSSFSAWSTHPDAELKFARKIETYLVTGFSVLELHFSTSTHHYDIPDKHAFGAFVLHLLGMHRIRTAIQKLRIVVLRSRVVKGCPVNCPCDEPKNWRTKNIPLINLEEVEIEGFEGEDHEFDFLKVIFRCAPMLKRMTVQMSDEVSTSNDRCSKAHDIFKAYPFVECNVYLSSGSKHSSQSSALA